MYCLRWRALARVLYEVLLAALRAISKTPAAALQLLALLHMVRQLNLLGGSEQGYSTNGAEIPTNGIGGEPAGQFCRARKCPRSIANMWVKR